MMLLVDKEVQISYDLELFISSELIGWNVKELGAN